MWVVVRPDERIQLWVDKRFAVESIGHLSKLFQPPGILCQGCGLFGGTVGASKCIQRNGLVVGGGARDGGDGRFKSNVRILVHLGQSVHCSSGIRR